MQEWSTAAKLGLGLVVLAVIGGIVSALLIIGTNMADSGTKDVQKTLVQVNKSEWNKYNGTELTGAQVKAYLDLIVDKDMSAFVSTKAWQTSGTGYCWNYGVLSRNVRTQDDNGFQYYTVNDNTNDSEDHAVSPCLVGFSKKGGYICWMDYTQKNNDRSTVNDKAHLSYISDDANFWCDWVYDQNSHLVGVFFKEV